MPQALGFIAKPYDLEFPIIPCHFTPPFIENSQILAWLREEFGHKAVHAFSRPTASEFGLARFTVDVDNEPQENLKLRLYLDESARKCNLFPFALPNALPKDETLSSDTYFQKVFSGIAEGLRGMPPEAEIFPGESEYRLKVFLGSLSFGHAMLREESVTCWLSTTYRATWTTQRLCLAQHATVLRQTVPDVLQELSSRHKAAPERVLRIYPCRIDLRSSLGRFHSRFPLARHC